MAYRIEEEPNGGQAIVIDGWDKGIAADPYAGINRMLGVDLETHGEVAVGYPITTSTTSGGTLGNPIAKSVRLFPTYATPAASGDGSAQSYAILDATGQVYESTSITGTWTFLSSSNSTAGSSTKDGIAYWLGYLFKFRNDKVDYWNGSTWTTAWKTITAGVQHFAYVASDNKLYFTNGNYIGSIFAPDPTAFDPTSAPTYTFTAQLLAIPYTDNAISLAEVGGGNAAQSTLLIGGALNAIYPWDKISTSFGLPIYVADGYIKRMVSANQNAFIFPGNVGGRGRIYITNGSQADDYFKVPDYLFNEQDPYFEWGDAMFHRNNLVFGFFVSKNGGSGTIISSEVWALRLADKQFRSISNIPANATGKGSATVLIPAFNPKGPGFSYIIGWNDSSSTPGIGYSGTAAGINATANAITTDLIPVGTFLQNKTYSQVEFKLRTPLAAGESITITPVVDAVTGSALSFSPTITTNSISAYATVNFEKAQWLQFNITMVGNSASSGVRLKEIRIR